MISKELYSAIENWARASTWHTTHASDDERFYDLVSAFAAAGPENYDPDAFMDVAGEMIRRHHRTLGQDFVDQNLSSKVIAAEQILGYVAHRARRAA